MTTQPQKPKMEQLVTTQTFFKVVKTESLQDLKESFMEEYKDQPEMLKQAGFTGDEAS